jgi:glutamate decarboxylase
MPADAQDIMSLRIVLRPHINHNVAQELAQDVISSCKYLDEHGGSATAPKLHAHAKEKSSPTKC